MASEEKRNILLVEDDPQGREAMVDWLTSEGFEVSAAADGQEAAQQMHEGLAVIVTDLRMPRTDGLEVLRLAKEKAPHAAVILMTAHGSVDSARAALKQGAFDYLLKPIKPKDLTELIRSALADRRMSAAIADLHVRIKQEHGFKNMVGDSPAMRAVFEKIRRAADVQSTVLITGESGTGKELVVRALHESGSRSDKPFVPINCAAIPESLIESELFGHEKGAFTGATGRRSGLFEVAEGGTLFIDEIAEMNLGLQSKLLRAIESRRIMPVGSSKEIEVDVRFVAATNRDLFEEVKKKAFREDLYYRLKVVELHLPPLRERVEDIPLLVGFFLEQIAEENGRPMCAASAEALDVLMSYNWPGNVRELRNTLEGIIVLSANNRIEAADLPEHIRGSTSARIVMRSGMTMAEIEKEAIRRTLDQADGRRTEAAKILGLSIRALERKIKEYALLL